MLRFLELPAALARDRVGACLRAVTASLLLMKLLTSALWTGERVFPLAPVTDALPSLPAPLTGSMYFAELGLLVWLLFKPGHKKATAALLVLFGVWCATDLTRLQPWYYLYALLLASTFTLDASKEAGRVSALACQQIVVVGLYVWSGLHKHTYDYYHYVHGFIARSLEPYLPDFLYGIVEGTSVIAPWFECAVGLLLLFGRTRKLAVLAIAGMHTYLFLCLGPLCSGWNSIVLPWNLSMIVLVWILFYGSDPFEWKALIAPRAKWVGLTVTALAVGMPALRYFDAWDNNLSFCLYSGKTKGLTFYIREGSESALPANVRRLFKETTNPPDLFYCDANAWSMDELGVPVYPQERVYRQISRELCRRYFEQGQFFAFVKRRPGYVKEGTTYSCDDL